MKLLKDIRRAWRILERAEQRGAPTDVIERARALYHALSTEHDELVSPPEYQAVKPPAAPIPAEAANKPAGQSAAEPEKSDAEVVSDGAADPDDVPF